MQHRVTNLSLHAIVVTDFDGSVITIEPFRFAECNPKSIHADGDGRLHYEIAPVAQPQQAAVA